MKWTNEDEALLTELLERKRSTENMLRERVERAVNQFYHSHMDAQDVAIELIDHAAVIRKVLEPFDKEG